eukprot:CAMPEP_0194054498 /NCGR_PEP_ID=MMETSP0009_2-20130614/53589_1 /TAXON_ID=210454 /ORGANISM="Grammatophora oceanica, Strain CCMP 410" /LENGTH=55 /DNA_ID=CAMNT_0038703005 /DNA_START=34 /DNA_END=198 /DNA_ORIENTATION=-
MIVFLGRHPHFYKSAGNMRLKEIVRELLPSYVKARAKNTRGAKSQILRNALKRAE